MMRAAVCLHAGLATAHAHASVEARLRIGAEHDPIQRDRKPFGAVRLQTTAQEHICCAMARIAKIGKFVRKRTV